MRLGVSPTLVTTIVHSQLWVSVSPLASPTHLVPCFTTVFLSWPALSANLPIWLFWLIFSLIPWLLEFHAAWFSGTSGCLLILHWLLSSFRLCEEVKGLYLRLHLGQNSDFFLSYYLCEIQIWACSVFSYAKSNNLTNGRRSELSELKHWSMFFNSIELRGHSG